MDLRKTIEDLRREKEKLDRAIAALEELQGVVTGGALKTKSRNKKIADTKTFRGFSTSLTRKKLLAAHCAKRQRRHGRYNDSTI